MNPNLRVLTRPLLFLVIFNLIPQIELRPLWISAFAFVLVGYRLWLDYIGGRLPPRWIQWTVQITIAIAIWQHYHSIFGDEAGGALLTLLTCVKVFELNRKRDYFVTCVLCLLVLMSYLLIEQGLMITGFLVVDIIGITAMLYAIEEERWTWPLWRGFIRSSVAMVLKCAPLVVLMFVLFPRFNTGFGHGAGNSAKTGVSDSLQPGSIAKLVNSDELVFRATFLDGEVPPNRQLYWRGAVLDKSNGINWERSKPESRSLQPDISIYKPDIEIYLEPGSDKFLFALEDTGAVAFPNQVVGNRISPRDGKTYELAEPLQTRERYYIARTTQRADEEAPGEQFLSTDEKPSIEMHKFLRKFESKPANQTVRELLDYFHTSGYKYSLKPPHSRGIDDFLFKNKIGFCEHFAGAMATMLRNLKIPARVVVGFQGGTRSFFQNYISVRDHDAHAWIEYYDATAKRWRRVDPTAEVEPLRLSEGSDSYFEQGRNLMPAWMPTGFLRTYLRTRALMDEVEASWTGFLLHFDLARQKELLAKLGMDEVLFRALSVFLLLSVALILAVLYFLEAQRREPLSIDEKIYRQLITALKKWNIAKTPQEGPMTLMGKVQSFNPQLAKRVEPILQPLIMARFGRVPLNAQLVNILKQNIRALKRFKLS